MVCALKACSFDWTYIFKRITIICFYLGTFNIILYKGWVKIPGVTNNIYYCAIEDVLW